MDEFTVIILLGAIGWFWYSSIQAREIAILAAKMRCESQGLILLDQTIVLSKIRLRRDPKGEMRFEREYQFEFSSNGDDRFEGMMILHAGRITKFLLDTPTGRNLDH